VIDAIEHPDFIEQFVEPRMRVAADHRHVVHRAADRIEFLDFREALQRAHHGGDALGCTDSPQNARIALSSIWRPSRTP
jgi:hypothetical protein